MTVDYNSKAYLDKVDAWWRGCGGGIGIYKRRTLDGDYG